MIGLPFTNAGCAEGCHIFSYGSCLNCGLPDRAAAPTAPQPKQFLVHQPNGLPAGRWVVSEDANGNKLYFSIEAGSWYFIERSWYKLEENS